MKSFLAVAFFAATSLAQGIYINSPADDTVVKAGSTVTVQIARPIYIQDVTEVGIAIGFVGCPNNACPEPQNVLGAIQYTGPYNPEFDQSHVQNQKFTVTVPDSLSGPAQIGVVRAYLVGAGPMAVIGTTATNITVN